MKHYYALALLLLCCFFKWNSTSAQTVIMDAHVDWTHNNSDSYSGILTIFLTDTSNISGVQVSMGSHPDSSDIYTASYTGATNGNFGSGNPNVSMQSSNLAVNLGSFAYHSDYYINVKVNMEDNSLKMIQIHSSN